MRRTLGVCLVAAGLASMAWPAANEAYGQYWQTRLEQEFAAPPATVGEFPLSPPPVPVAPSPTPPLAASAAGPRAKAPALRTAPKRRPTQPEKPLPDVWIPRRGQAFARLHIDRIGLRAVVVEGDDDAALRKGPGHLPDSGLPWESRNCAVAAHRDAWFRRLPELRVGDRVRLETRAAVYDYAVESRKVVTPDRADLLDRGSHPDLTLITCTGPGYPQSRYRLLVFCRRTAETWR